MLKGLYTGPLSGVTLMVEGKNTEVMLHPGATVELPECDYINTLIAMGYFTPEAAPVAVQEVIVKVTKNKGADNGS